MIVSLIGREVGVASHESGGDMGRVLVSGCLNGRPIRYNATGVDVESEIWDRWEQEGRLVHFCPELAAGFSVPRPPAETAARVAGGFAGPLA